MSKLSLIVEIKATPGKRQALLKEFVDVLSEIQAEDGCELYTLHVAKDNPDLIVIMEQWTTAESQAVHMQTAHMKTLQDRITGLRDDSARLVTCEPVSNNQ